MNLLSILPLLAIMVVILMVGSLIFRSPKQDLQGAFAEGAIWSSGFFLAFSTEFLLLFHS